MPREYTDTELLDFLESQKTSVFHGVRLTKKGIEWVNPWARVASFKTVRQALIGTVKEKGL